LFSSFIEKEREQIPSGCAFSWGFEHRASGGLLAA